MRLQELAQVLDLQALTPGLERPGDETGGPAVDATGAAALDADITRAYASDLLSDVLANAPAGGILITIQVHLNVIAVASHAELAAVIFAGGRHPDDDVRAKAIAEGVSLYVSPADTFDVVGRLYRIGVKVNHALTPALQTCTCTRRSLPARRTT